MAAAAVAILTLRLAFVGCWCAAGVSAQSSSQPPQRNITLGSSLAAGDNATAASWASPSGHFAFGFYPEAAGGYRIGVWLATTPNRTIVWTALRDDSPVTAGVLLTLTPDGSLIWSPPGGGGQRTTISSPAGSSSAAYAAMGDSGQFGIYNSTGDVLWSTFDSPTDTVLGGQRLPRGGVLKSFVSAANQSTGRFQLKMQRDSNLVAYPLMYTDSPGDAYYASGTDMHDPPLALRLTTDGRLYLEGEANRTIYRNLGQAGPVSKEIAAYFRLVLDADGAFRLYSDRFNRSGGVWAEEVEWDPIIDKCQVKGICGLNSYCSNADDEVRCFCPEGYHHVDSRQPSLGCSRNFAGDECAAGGAGTFNMTKMINVYWLEQPYSRSSSVSAEQCMAACEEDCFCDAALFDGAAGTCNKQTLPLRYGKRDSNKIAFIKVSSQPAKGGDPLVGGQPPAEEKTKTKKISRGLLVAMCIAFVACSAALCCISGGLLFFLRREQKRVATSSDFSGFLDVEDMPLRAFSYGELERATGNFTEVLGKGSFGTVFKGMIAGEKAVAVKRLDENMVNDQELEFQREVRAIGRTHHRNLVRLLGFCNEAGCRKLLVYDYMRNGSLADLLFSPAAAAAAAAAEEIRPPRWKERLRIAVDIAKGLHYLHDECEAKIVHCDIKPENVLIDENGAAKIADFGLSKLLRPEQTRTMTQIRGTRGYVAPEWFRKQPVTVKADVYSFGVVLLETAFRRRNVDPELPEEETVLTDWAYDRCMSAELPRTVDGEEVHAAELGRVVKVGLWCIQEEPAYRPSMKNVVLMLEGNLQVAPPPPPSSFS